MTYTLDKLRLISASVGNFLLSKKPVIACLLLIAVLMTGVATAADNNTDNQSANIVTVNVDGEQKSVATEADTVSDALERLDVDLGSEDKTEPSGDAQITGRDFIINVYRARQITIVDGVNSYTVMTAERSPARIAEEAGFKTKQEDKFAFSRSEDPFEGHPGTQMIIKRSRAIKLDLYGKKTTVNTHALTVGELLDERGIKLSGGDELSQSKDSPIYEGMTLSIANYQRKLETVEEEVAFDTEKIQDEQQPTTYRKVKQAGVKGKKMVTYEIVIKNGGEAKRVVKEQVVTKKPVKEIVIVGAKGFTGSLGQWLSTLRGCESGGNYQTNTGNGYYGAYQFSAGTWSSLNTGYARADLAPPAVQDQAIIDNTNRSSGGLATQNPGCYQKHGLSAFPPG